MRLRSLDALLLVVLLPLWAVTLTFDLAQVAAGRPTVWPLPVDLESNADPGHHPRLRWVFAAWKGGAVLTPGDILLRAGAHDLGGVSTPLGLTAKVLDAGQQELPVPIALQRDGAVRTIGLDISRAHGLGLFPLWSAFCSLVFTATAVLLLLRAPEAPATRPLFLALMTLQFYSAANFPGPPWLTYATMAVRTVGAAIASPAFVQAMLLLVPETAPRTSFGRRWPWLLVIPTIVTLASQVLGVPFSPAVGWRWLAPLAWGLFALGVLGVLTRSFVLADRVGRRRIKWVMLACYFLYLPRLVESSLNLLGYDLLGSSESMVTTVVAAVVVPICLLIAVVRYNLFDIDRLISVTASYTVLGVAVLGTLLAGFPRLASMASTIVGLDPVTGQLIFGLALAGVLVPAQRSLRPQIDRLFFAERYAVERGIAELLDELSDCASPEALYTHAGERLSAILHPDSCVVYARTGDAFAPAFVRGRAVPAAFEGNGVLVTSLTLRTTPLAAHAWQRRRAPALAPFDRAALETLGVEVVVPVRRSTELLAFICLGGKRSGDVYTETDLTLLAAVAGKVSDELVRYDLADLVARGRAMEEVLRRYVPAAVTTQLAAGGGVEPAEREVSVLFVDIRSYTSYAEAREAAEVFTTVNRYAETVSAIACERGGSVAEFSGDGMMIVFGAPQALPAKERAAVEAGREIIDAVATLAPGGAAAAPLSVGVGIATGPAFVGDVQSAERRIWTAIGNTVNLAARLQQLTRAIDAAMVIDAPTWSGARYVAADFVSHPQTSIRGRAEPEDVWALPAAGEPRRGT